MYCVIKADRKYPVTELIHIQAEGPCGAENVNLSTYSTEVGLLPATSDFLDEILRHATFQYSVHNAASLEGTLCKNLDQGYIKINGPLKGKFLLGSRALSSFFSSSIRALPSFPFPQFLFHISSHPQFHHFL